MQYNRNWIGLSELQLINNSWEFKHELAKMLTFYSIHVFVNDTTLHNLVLILQVAGQREHFAPLKVRNLLLLSMQLMVRLKDFIFFYYVLCCIKERSHWVYFINRNLVNLLLSIISWKTSINLILFRLKFIDVLIW